MSPLPHNNESLSNDSTVQTTHSENLIVKAYSNLLSNKTVQTGIKQLSIISQPLIERFDHRLVRLTNKVKRIVARDNIYTHLATIWLSHTLPFNGTVVSFETFAQEYKAYFRNHKRQQNPKTLNIYYQFACESWSTLNEPSTEDIKNTMLLIAARTINKAFHFEGETLSNALNNTFKTLIEKRGELVSNESFLKLVKTTLGEDFINKNYQTVDAPSQQFYTFAKRFLVLDFPLATEGNKDVVKFVKNFVHENSFYYGDAALDFVEKYLNTITHLVGQPEGEFAQDTTITEKAQRVLKKALNLSTFSVKKLESTVHQLQGTETYVYLNTHLHLNDKIDQAILLGSKGYQLLRENILTPSLNTFELVRNKTRDQVTLIVHNLDVQALKRNYSQLRAKYDVLQRCAVIIAGETVNLVFDKKNLAELGEKGKKELFRVYQELKTLETQKVVELSLEYYAAILKKAKQTYSVASQSVDSQKKIAVEQESEKKESDSPSTNVGEKEASGSSEEESH